MSRIQATDYQKAVQSLVKRSHDPGRQCGFNALRHVSKAWDIREIDPEMALLRCYCAEEEAAAAIFLALKRLRYQGAEALKHKSHVHKLAVSPFLWMVNKAFTVVHSGGFQPEVSIEGEEGHQCMRVRIWLPGLSQVVYPMPPLHFSLSEGEVPYRFERELDTLKNVGSVKTMAEYVRNGIDKRNWLLYASGAGHIDSVGDVEPIIQSQLETVTKLLTLYLLIDLYPQHQLFVQQCLDVFIRLVAKLPEEPLPAEGSATS
jgi:hypothetical protein